MMQTPMEQAITLDDALQAEREKICRLIDIQRPALWPPEAVDELIRRIRKGDYPMAEVRNA